MGDRPGNSRLLIVGVTNLTRRVDSSYCPVSFGKATRIEKLTRLQPLQLTIIAILSCFIQYSHSIYLHPQHHQFDLGPMCLDNE